MGASVGYKKWRARIFPRYGKVFADFSTVWKKVFHGVENFGVFGARRREFFHGMEKSFPRYGKVLGFWGAGGVIFPRCGKKFATVWKRGDGATGSRGGGEVDVELGVGDGDALFAAGGEYGVANVAGGGGDVLSGGVHPEV